MLNIYRRGRHAVQVLFGGVVCALLLSGLAVESASAAPANKSTSVVAVVPAQLATSSSCRTRSYDYSTWNFWRAAKWKVLNKCKTISLYKRTQDASGGSVFAAMFCGGIAKWSSFLGFISGPFCVDVFRVDAARSRRYLKYAATHAGKCYGMAPVWDTNPWGRTAVYKCRYK